MTSCNSSLFYCRRHHNYCFSDLNRRSVTLWSPTERTANSEGPAERDTAVRQARNLVVTCNISSGRPSLCLKVPRTSPLVLLITVTRRIVRIFGGMILIGQSAHVPFCLPQVTRKLTRDLSQVSAVRGQPLTLFRVLSSKLRVTSGLLQNKHRFSITNISQVYF
jgi:hypothetical protein